MLVLPWQAGLENVALVLTNSVDVAADNVWVTGRESQQGFKDWAVILKELYPNWRQMLYAKGGLLMRSAHRVLRWCGFKDPASTLVGGDLMVETLHTLTVRDALGPRRLNSRLTPESRRGTMLVCPFAVLHVCT